jgi:type II secretory pathway pseudopilin PulG
MIQDNNRQLVSGTTLLELVIALFISSVLIAGAFKAYQYTMASAGREKEKSELQSDLITFSNIIEKDIRMAGCGLPGNGLKADLSVPSLTIFTNEAGHETTLDSIVQPAHSRAFVADASGFTTRGGICLAADGIDTIYRSVSRVGINSMGSDTVYFDESANTSYPFPVTDTHVYPTMCLRYTVSGAPPKVYRSRNSQVVPIGGGIDSVYVTARDNSGASVGASVKNAAVLTVVMAGFIGSGGNRVFIADSTEVNLRNRN